MKRLIKNLSIFLLFILGTTIPINNSFAEEYDENNKSITVRYDNPIYKNLDIINIELKANMNAKSYTRSYNSKSTNTFDSIAKAASYMRGQMVKRSNTIKFTLKTSKFNKNMHSEIFKQSVKERSSGKSSEGDYLLWHFYNYNCKMNYSSKEVTFIFSMNYLSTYNQEKQVNTKTKEVLKKLNVYNKSEYTKVKAVHDYIMKNIDYDYDMKNYSAYDGLIKGKTVCQGYATLTYKMLKELDIENRIIIGKDKISGMEHAWNICKIGTRWYNMDNTWDDTLSTNDKISYNYFLKNNKIFKDHDRNNEYKTSSFNSSYPMSSTSYVVNVIKPSEISNLEILSYGKKYIQLKWHKSSNTSGYSIYRSNKKDGTYKKIKDVSTTSYKDDKLNKSTTYYYKIRPYTIKNNTKYFGNYSIVIKATTK